MPSMWETLGLEGPSDDLRVIKKAYAKKLRVTRPDEDPAGFMALREALESAKNYVHYQSQKSDYEWVETGAEISIDETSTPKDLETTETSHSENNMGETEINPAIDYTPLDADAVVPESHNPKQQSETYLSPEKTLQEKTVMEAVQALLKDPFGRADAARWANLLEDPRLEGIDALIDFEDSFRSFLLNELGYFDGEANQHNRSRNPKLISTKVGTMIFNHMGWRDTRGRPLYIQDQIEWLRQDLDVINKSKLPVSHASNPAYESGKYSGKSNAWTFVITVFAVIAIARVMNQFL